MITLNLLADLLTYGIGANIIFALAFCFFRFRKLNKTIKRALK